MIIENIMVKYEYLEKAVTETPDDLILKVSGEVKSNLYKDEASLDPLRKNVTVGRFGSFLIDSERALNEEHSLYDICNSHTPEVYDFYTCFYSEKDTLRDALGVGPSCRGNILIIDYIHVLKEYRGNGLGEVIIKSIIRNFKHRVKTIVLRAYPLQFSKRERGKGRWESDLRNLSQKDLEGSREKLIGFFENMGFKVFKDSYMYFPGDILTVF